MISLVGAKKDTDAKLNNMTKNITTLMHQNEGKIEVYVYI